MKIIVYVVDCLRADHVSCYGYSRPTTPNIDALAHDGVLFEHAFAPSTWTKPIAASILTGLYPPAHGLRMRTDVVERNIRSLPEWLGAEGYTTLAISSIGNVSSSLGIGRGFDHFIDLYKDPRLRGKRAIADVRLEKLFHEEQGEVVFPLAADINDALFPWIEQNNDRDFFAFLWAMDPHDPYDPPDDWKLYVDPEYQGRMDGSRELAKQAVRPEDLQHLIDLYDSEILYTDHCFGQLITYLKDKGIYDESLILVMGDHGEAFGDHGHMIHGHLPFEEIVHVPLIMKLPGQSNAGDDISGLVSLVDVLPTVVDVAGVPDNEWALLLQGISLLTALGSGSKGTHEMVFSETQATKENNLVYSVRTSDWKFISVKSPARIERIQSLGRRLLDWRTLGQILRNPRFYIKRQIAVPRSQLYNLIDDPGETDNLVHDMEGLTTQFQTSIEEWLQRCNKLAARYEDLAVRHEIDKATLEHLRALGYID